MQSTAEELQLGSLTLTISLSGCEEVAPFRGNKNADETTA